MATINPNTGKRQLYGRRIGRPLKDQAAQRLDAGMAQFGLTLDALERHRDLTDLFAHRPREVWLEIGFGGGEHLAYQAAHNPDVGLIGAEFFANGVSSACGHLLRSGLGNARVLHGDGRELLDRLPDVSLMRAFILHPDPWPKKRHHERRIVNTDVLDALARVMRPGAELRLATDHASYKPWMLQKLLDHPAFVWTAQTKRDWQERPADWPQTRYEAKALREGRVPMVITAKRL
jgi:tRNA (guanine-N7-)-methyltransferase